MTALVISVVVLGALASIASLAIALGDKRELRRFLDKADI